MRRAALVLMACALGCADDDLHIRLDVDKNCNEVTAHTVLADAAEGAIELIDAAMDPAASGPWLLVRVDSGGGAVTEAWHVTDGTVDRRIPIPLPPEPGGTFAMRASPIADEAYVLYRGLGAFRIYRVDLLLASAQESEELSDFPHDIESCTPCDTSAWHRDLIFLDEDPFAISVPPGSETETISVWVGRIVPNPGDARFVVGTENKLEFKKSCLDAPDPAFCEESKQFISYPSVVVLARQIDPRPRTSRVLVQRERAEETVPGTFPDVFVVSLSIEDGLPTGVMRSYQDGYEVTTDPPHGLAVDEFATYSLYASRPPGGVRVLRLPSPAGDLAFEDLTDEVQPHDYDTMLLQLDADIALARILDDGTWEVTKTFPDAPTQSRVTIHEADAPITAVHGIGAGTFRIDKNSGRSDIVQLRCVERPLD